MAAWRVGAKIRNRGGGIQLPHVAKIKTPQHEREHVAAQAYGRKGTRVLAAWGLPPAVGQDSNNSITRDRLALSRRRTGPTRVEDVGVFFGLLDRCCVVAYRAYLAEVQEDEGELRSDLDITSPRVFNEQTFYYRFDYPHAPTESPSATEPEPGDIQTAVLLPGRCVTLLCLSCAYR